MLLNSRKEAALLLLLILCVIQGQVSDSYRTEIEITPAPPEEATTKKSGFFGGIKKWFGSSSQTTVDPVLEATTVKSIPPVAGNNQKPQPLVISNAPMVPLGPRPDTPLSSPFGAGQPQWPNANANNAAAASTTTASPNKQQSPTQWHPPHSVGGVVSTTTLKPSNQQNANNMQDHLPRPIGLGSGFAPNNPPKPLPSGLDLSYGEGFNAASRPQQVGKPGFRPAPVSPSTSSSTPIASTSSTPRSQQIDFDLRGGFQSTPLPGKENNPSLPPHTRTPIKEDFPALPTPKSPMSAPASPFSPSSSSAWNKPLPGNVGVPSSAVTTSTTVRSPLPKPPTTEANGVAFVPHSGTTTTVRPGVAQQGNSLATDDEIQSLTEILYAKEVNSQLNLITVKAQGKTRSIDSTDEAPQALLEVDSKAFNAPTIAKMRLLFNNYEPDTLVNEHVSGLERNEENDFVDAVMATSVMRQAMSFLQNKGIVTPDPKTHSALVKELWFTQYSRGSGKIGSSGFEHVFVNEVKNGTIIGLHNWVYFYDEEKAGHLDYKGYLNQLDLGTKGKVMKVRFTHNGLNKPVNTLFIGTSPELELALYTVCFKLRPDRTCTVSLDNKKFGIITYSWRYRGKSLIGSAYPEI